MNRFEWIVPIVVFLVYVLGHILKAKEAGQQAQQPAKRNPGQELDRFLQEIERLRRQQENRGPSAQSKSDDEDDEMPTEERPVVVVREVRPSPMLPRVVVQVQPTPQTQPQRTRDPEPAERTRQVVLPSKAPSVTYTRRSSVNPAATAMQLLANRKNIATAFALNEILSPPKCKR